MAPVWKQSVDAGLRWVIRGSLKIPDRQLELTFRKKNVFGFFVIDVALSPHTSSSFIAQQSFENIIIVVHVL